MLSIVNLTKSFGERVLFENVQLQMEPGERLGLIGRNGYGKTTLFRIILNEDFPDHGEISTPKNYSIGHLNQHLHFTRPSIVEEASLGLPASKRDHIWETEKILAGLGFSQEDMQKPPHQFSGGYQIRINLAKVLVSEPNLLLLDEPTNYLDILSIRWLAEFLRKWKGEMILVTHDRHFMDSVTTHSMIIHRKLVRKVVGPTDKLIEQLLIEEEVHENTRLNEEKKRKQEEVFINRFRAKARMAGMVQSRVKALEKRAVLQKLDTISKLEFRFRFAPFSAKNMMSIHNLNFTYGHGGPLLIRDFNLSIGNRERVAIIGKNGKGKSTLMKLLAGKLNLASGKIAKHPLLKIGFFEQSNVVKLDPQKTVAEEIVSADPDKDMRKARDICGAMMFEGDAALKKISILSGGEKSRVCLGKLLIVPNHLLLLDEPSNHLDTESCDALANALEQFPGSVVLITHHEGLLKSAQGGPDKLVIFQTEGHTNFDGHYQDFLREVGWESETIPKNKDDGSESKLLLNKKELRRLRAEKNQEKSRALKPLRKKIEDLEKKITVLEEEMNDMNFKLLEAYESGDGDEISHLAKVIHDHKEKSESLYSDLNQSVITLEKKENSFLL